TPGGLAPDLTSGYSPKLQSSTSHGLYQGVILATGDLPYWNGTTWQSALTQTEWDTLVTYEATFGVRQVSWYTYPQPRFGFNWPSAADSSPTNAQFASYGQALFSYVNTANPVPITNAWTYRATP